MMSIDRCHSCNTPVDTDKSAPTWPTHPDGTNKTMGEMTLDERREQTAASHARRKARELETISKHSTQVGGVRVNFTVGRVK